jgi:SAM-dependent methyltransferase
MAMASPMTNTYVFDPDSAPELARLINQDRMITRAMGGPLTGIPENVEMRNILDLGCGPGGWVLDVAFSLPDAEVEGWDVSRPIVDYANARARTQRLMNASFGVMDINQPFDLPDCAFDLVNARFLAAVLKREAWPLFLRECTRVLRPGGLLRLTEAADFGATTSEAVNHLMDLIRNALYQLGYGFSPDNGLNILPMLYSFLQQQEYRHIDVCTTALNYSAKTEAWIDTYHSIDIIGVQMKPVLLKLGFINEELFSTLHHQVLIDLQVNAFCGIGHVTTLIGKKSLHSAKTR